MRMHLENQHIYISWREPDITEATLARHVALAVRPTRLRTKLAAAACARRLYPTILFQ